MPKPAYADHTLDVIIVAAGGLPEGEIEIASPTGWGDGRTLLRQSRREALRERLGAAAERYVLAARAAAVPSQASMAREYKVVHSHLNRALRALLPEDRATRGRLHVALGMHLRDGDARQRIVALAELCRAARSLYRWKGVKPKLSREERNQGDRALDEFVIDLLAIWVHVFDRKMGTTVGSQGSDREGDVGGPMIRFMQAALTLVLAVVPTEKAIRARVRRLLKSTLEKT